MGNQDIKNLIQIIIDGIKIGIQVKADGGKISALDLPLLLKLIQDVPSAFQNISQIPAEFKAMNAAEAEDLVAFAMAALSIEKGKSELIIEQALKLIIDGVNLAIAIKS